MLLSFFAFCRHSCFLVLTQHACCPQLSALAGKLITSWQNLSAEEKAVYYAQEKVRSSFVRPWSVFLQRSSVTYAVLIVVPPPPCRPLPRPQADREKLERENAKELAKEKAKAQLAKASKAAGGGGGDGGGGGREVGNGGGGSGSHSVKTKPTEKGTEGHKEKVMLKACPAAPEQCVSHMQVAPHSVRFR